jgi:hypothetical protein
MWSERDRGFGYWSEKQYIAAEVNTGMALEQRGEHWYGDSAADIQALFARKEGDPVEVVRSAVCECGGTVFSVQIDDEHQEAAWFCRACDTQYLFHTRRVSGYYPGDPEAETECVNCSCTDRDGSYFELAIGVTLYTNTEDVDWAFLACRCVACGVTGYLTEWHRIEYPCSELFAHMGNKQDIETEPEDKGA